MYIFRRHILQQLQKQISFTKIPPSWQFRQSHSLSSEFHHKLDAVHQFPTAGPLNWMNKFEDLNELKVIRKKLLEWKSGFKRSYHVIEELASDWIVLNHIGQFTPESLYILYNTQPVVRAVVERDRDFHIFQIIIGWRVLLVVTLVSKITIVKLAEAIRVHQLTWKSIYIIITVFFLLNLLTHQNGTIDRLNTQLVYDLKWMIPQIWIIIKCVALSIKKVSNLR